MSLNETCPGSAKGNV